MVAVARSRRGVARESRPRRERPRCDRLGRSGALLPDSPEPHALAAGTATPEPTAPDSPDAHLTALQAVAVERRRATAEEYRLIALILDDAVARPQPWVGQDPTLDLAWDDTRGRSVAAVRRDRLDMAERAAVAEIAVRLRVSEQTVRVRASQARTLQERSPVSWQTFVDGRTSERHAVETARLASSLPHDDPASWTAFDVGAADRASRLTPARFSVAARALRERVHAESLEERHRRAGRDRGVWLTAELDGMATLSALLPADRAHAAMSTLDRAARHLATAPDEERTLAQLRADIMADLLVAPVGNGVGVTPTHVDRVKTGSGIGLRNVNERLRVIYGANYQLQLDSVPGEGTCARIVIPELIVPARITA